MYEVGGYVSVYLIAGIAGILALAEAVWFFCKPTHAEIKNVLEPKKEVVERVPFFKNLWRL